MYTIIDDLQDPDDVVRVANRKSEILNPFMEPEPQRPVHKDNQG